MASGHTRLRAWVFVTLLAMATVFAFMVVVLSMRYGGPEGLFLRVQAEVAGRRPHPQFVPTPLPISSDVSRSWKTETATSLTPAEASAMGAAAIPSHDSAGENSVFKPRVVQVATVAPVPLHLPAAETVELRGFDHMWQTWNNCGPATLAMDLSYFGIRLEQADVAAVLKPNRDDRNVSPEEIAEFARSQGLNALVRVNGDSDRLRLFLSNGVPALIETWLEPEPNNGMGHYRLLTGYDNKSQQWTAFDSYVSVGVDPSQPYRGILLPYEEVESLWTVFNRAYILIYTDDQTPLVRDILGQDFDSAAMWRRALQQAYDEVQRRPDDAFAWFNLGSDLAALDRFEEAAAAYDKARVIGLPWRMLWYQFGPFEAYYETGRHQELIVLADSTIKSAGGNVEEIYYWKGWGLISQGDIEGARQVWQQAVELNPNYKAAAAALETIDVSDPEGGQAAPAANAGG